MIEWTNYLNRMSGDIRYTPYYKRTTQVNWNNTESSLGYVKELLSHIYTQYNMYEGDDEAEDFTVPSEQELLEFMNNTEDEV